MSAPLAICAGVPLVGFHLPQHADQLGYLDVVVASEYPSLEVQGYRGCGVHVLDGLSEFEIILLIFCLLLFLS